MREYTRLRRAGAPLPHGRPERELRVPTPAAVERSRGHEKERCLVQPPRENSGIGTVTVARISVAASWKESFPNSR